MSAPLGDLQIIPLLAGANARAGFIDGASRVARTVEDLVVGPD
ncbi:hypothetical protein [Mycobacteroides salmoniphilum]|nr:hypothetical protein [Mycobacteroides salmoniphilum]